ncbi:MAG TPA: RIO1 family regulatory kinase/ATPase [Thermomicrobiales bacterium]|nr:RIO1 family regulatory kinase/ATPase [Thermomicrobiales bacterium]
MPVTESDIPEVFFEDGWIDAVEYLVSSGKEGTVYCCHAAPDTGHDRLAVKIHRGRTQRSFKNDAIYLSGRVAGVSLTGSAGIKASGKVDRRLSRAVAKRSRTGIAAIEQSWITYEYSTMQILHRAGARVPQPLTMSGHAMLMEFIGDAEGPAPKLKHVELSAAEARQVADILVDEIALWLANDRIHGDLSSFNVLYWDDAPAIIDFPQAVSPWDNPDARFLLERDVRNIATWAGAYGIRLDHERITHHLWDGFVRGTLEANPELQALSRW